MRIAGIKASGENGTSHKGSQRVWVVQGMRPQTPRGAAAYDGPTVSDLPRRKREKGSRRDMQT
jgi:hypothetical protein